MKPLQRIAWTTATLLVMAGTLFGEKIVVKKSGKVLDGSIVERRDDYVKIVHAGGLGWYHLDDLEAADRGLSQLSPGLTRPDPRAIGYATITAPQVVIRPRVENYGRGSGMQTLDLIEETADGYMVWLNHNGTNVLAHIAKRDGMGNENAQIVHGRLSINPQRTPVFTAAPILLKRGEEHPVLRIDDDTYVIIYKKASFETTVPIARSQASYDFLSRELRFAREQREKGLVFFGGQWVTKEERSRLLAERRASPRPVSQLERMKAERRQELLRAQKDRQRQLEEAQVRNLKKLQEGTASYPVPASLVARPPRPAVRVARLQLKAATPEAGEAVRFTPIVHLETAAGGPGDVGNVKIVVERFDLGSGTELATEEKSVAAAAAAQTVECAFTPVGLDSFDAVDQMGYFIEAWNGPRLLDFHAEPPAVGKLAELVAQELFEQATATAEEPADDPPPPDTMMPGAPGMMPGAPGMMPGAPPDGMPGAGMAFRPEMRESREDQETGLIRNEVTKVLVRNNIRGRPVEVQPDPSGQTILVVVSDMPDMPEGQLSSIHRQVAEQASVVNPDAERQIRVSLQTSSGRTYPPAP